jgi:lambda repressor-like predicted transcriptional regulator
LPILAFQTPDDAAELGEKGVSTLHGAADAAHPRLTRATPLGRLHPKARRVVAEILHVMGLDRLFHIYQTQEEALRSF